ncbi:MAG TPA: Gldg family protein [Bdellovibrionota bacterium]|jgi:ABC-type uncharacterized transport system involved in gliding motility auxiliary subunit|nr:Gldg family protein [Bdellovibrionota bacterium]
MLSRIAQQTLIYSLIALVIIWGYVPFLWDMGWPAYTLLGLALCSLIAWGVAGLTGLRTFLAKRSSQFGISLAISALAIAAILVTVNVVANLYNQKKDITQAQLYSLSSQSKNIARQIQEGMLIEVWTTNIQQMAPNQDLAKFLENYRIESGGKIKVQVRNPNNDNLLAKERGITKDNVILLRAASGRESRIDNLNKDKIEEQITNALVQAIKGVKKMVCFTSGHGEMSLESPDNGGLSSIKQSLENSSYQTKTVSVITNTDVPTDCEALVIAGPKSEPTDNGLEVMKKYLSSGGKVLILFGATTPQKWNALIKPYGVELRDDIILDLSVQPPTIVATQKFTPGIDIVSSLDRPVILPQAASLALPTSGKSGNFTVKSMVSSESRAFGKKKNGMKAIRAQMVAGDLPGPLSVAALVEDPRATPAKNEVPGGIEGLMPPSDGHFDGDGHDHGHDHGSIIPEWLGVSKAWAQNKKDASIPATLPPATDDKPSETKLVVVASDLFVANSFVSQLGNSDFFMNSVSYLLADKDVLGIRPRQLKATRLQLSSETDRKVLATVFLLAGLCFLGAIAAASRRRKSSL